MPTKKQINESFYQTEPKQAEFITKQELNIILEAKLKEKSYYIVTPVLKKIENRTSDPASPETGQIWFRTDV